MALGSRCFCIRNLYGTPTRWVPNKFTGVHTRENKRLELSTSVVLSKTPGIGVNVWKGLDFWYGLHPFKGDTGLVPRFLLAFLSYDLLYRQLVGHPGKRSMYDSVHGEYYRPRMENERLAQIGAEHTSQSTSCTPTASFLKVVHWNLFRWTFRHHSKDVKRPKVRIGDDGPFLKVNKTYPDV